MNLRRLTPWTGHPYPLGASWDGSGVNFALFSQHASKVVLCLFDERGEQELAQIPLPVKTDNVWHAYVRGLNPGTVYGYRVYGPYDPQRGHRFNPNKLLIDPYARSLCGSFSWTDEHFGYRINHPAQDLSFDERDNAAHTMKCRVINSSFDWKGDQLLRIPWQNTIIYELHVKGFTKLNPRIPEQFRGTYTGLGHPASIKYLKRLGITAVELLPIHTFLDERSLTEKGLKNYWGYNTINFFTPTTRYAATDDPISEFKQMVSNLHAAGIEVILDVVYNHSAEGNHFGPTLSFKGIDNHAYYRLVWGSPRYYMDYTGCGNTFNLMNPRTLGLIMDSLRYWVTEMHVDGFRFDLAAALAREAHAVDNSGAFFDIIAQDPILSQVKLIAEPWDLGEGGYQLGNFPIGWAEWNGKYRETVRSFWRSDDGTAEQLSRRLTGSSDLYQHSGRSPCASINYITSHDGYTLQDLVSYNNKHNWANQEENRDGDSNNLSWNCGEEGATQNRNVLLLREQQKRNMLTTLLLSHGIPMITAGDEFGRTQQGNNNAYCQDNEISWINWDLSITQQTQLAFVRELILLRKKHIVFRRRFFTSCLSPNQGNPLHWYKPNSHPMLGSDWHRFYTKSFGWMLIGTDLHEQDQRGKVLKDNSFFVLFNAHWEALSFAIPSSFSWKVLIDTSKDPRDLRKMLLTPKAKYLVQPRSLVILVKEEHLKSTIASLNTSSTLHPLTRGEDITIPSPVNLQPF